MSAPHLNKVPNGRIREVVASTGIITTVAGSSTSGYGGDGGPATQAKLNGPNDVAVDGAGNLFIGDTQNGRVREVTASTGLIATVAGGGSGCTGQVDSVGDDCASTQATVAWPAGVALDGADTLYVADATDNRVRKVASSVGLADGYGYDAVGNMTSDNGITQTYDAANQIVAAGPITYTFDRNGNQLSSSEAGNPAWRYDAQNHALGYANSTLSDNFQVNGGGQRAQRSTTVTSTGAMTTGTYVVEPGGLAIYHQTAPVSQTVYYARDPGGRLLALIGSATADLRAVSCPGTTTCTTVGLSGTVLGTTSGGAPWRDQISGAAQWLYGAACPSSTTCFAVGSGGTIQVTTNGGTTWSGQSSGTTQLLLGIACLSTSTCYAVGTNGTIVATTNGGSTWTAQTSGTTSVFYAIACASTSTCIAVGQSGLIRATTNGGSTWSSQSSGTVQYLLGIACPSSTVCEAVGSTGIILGTTNGGATWTAQTSGTTQQLNGITCPNTSTCMVVGNAGTIRVTTNGRPILRPARPKRALGTEVVNPSTSATEWPVTSVSSYFRFAARQVYLGRSFLGPYTYSD